MVTPQHRGHPAHTGGNPKICPKQRKSRKRISRKYCKKHVFGWLPNRGFSPVFNSLGARVIPFSNSRNFVPSVHCSSCPCCLPRRRDGATDACVRLFCLFWCRTLDHPRECFSVAMCFTPLSVVVRSALSAVWKKFLPQRGWLASPPFPPPLPPPHEGASPHMWEFSHNKEKPSKRNKAESVTKHKVFESFAPHWSIFVTEKAEKPSSASKMMRFTWCLGNVGVEPNRGF